jgi:hypothetical protein
VNTLSLQETLRLRSSRQSLLGRFFLDHLAERGIKTLIVYRTVNWMALFLDRKFPDMEDTVNWQCIWSRDPQSASFGKRVSL